MPITIKVDLSLVEAKKPLCALADVILNLDGEKITIRRCAVFEKSGETPWATLPLLNFEKDGKKQFVALLDLPRDLKHRVLVAVLDEYRRKIDAR